MDLLRLMRPQQWIKNLFVLAPLMFAAVATQRGPVLDALGAFLAFCLAASAVYAFNDVLDRKEDQAHPIKKNRPVASGKVSIGAALTLAAVLAVGTLAISWTIRPLLAGLIAFYMALNLLYSVKLKHMVILDVFCIASFFVLRLLAGAVAIPVKASVWLLLCGGLLALYLGFAKRRHELVLLGDQSADHRSVLSHYSPVFLDQMSVVLLSVTIVSYIMYALTSETAQRVGSEALSYGTPFVLYGVFRYLYLVHKHDKGSPTETVLTDVPLLIDVGLWLAYNFWVLYRSA